MAETLNITGDASSMLANKFEPKRKFRWVLEIDGIDAFLCKTASRPQLTFEETKIQWINVERKLAGRATWGDMSVTLYDPIAPSGAQQVMEWIRLNFESITGRSGYSDFYKRDIVLKMLDPVGTVVELWDVKGAWVADCNFNDLDYSASDAVEITLSIKMDNCTLQY